MRFKRFERQVSSATLEPPHKRFNLRGGSVKGLERQNMAVDGCAADGRVPVEGPAGGSTMPDGAGAARGAGGCPPSSTATFGADYARGRWLAGVGGLAQPRRGRLPWLGRGHGTIREVRPRSNTAANAPRPNFVFHSFLRLAIADLLKAE